MPRRSSGVLICCNVSVNDLVRLHSSPDAVFGFSRTTFILVWPTSWISAVGGLIACVWVCVSEDMSPYCSAHDEWLIMKLCMYVGYHDADNVSNFDGDQVTQLNFKKRLYYYLRCFTDMALHSRYAITVSAAVATRSRADCSSMEDRGRPKSSSTSRTRK